MNTKMNLEEKVQQWFVDRNLHEANPVKQFLKLMEESGELFEGIAKALLSKEYFFASNNEVSGYRTKHTKKQLEDDGFGEVFNSPLFEIEEV